MKPPIEQLSEPREAGVIDLFIDDWQPEADTFAVETPSGAQITFRAMKDHGEMKTIQRAAQLQAESAGKNFPNKDVRELFNQDKQTVALSSVMAQLVVSPKLVINDFLKLAKKAPLGFEFLVNSMNDGQSRAMKRMEARLLEQAKNALSGTPTGAPASELPATAGSNTPTSLREKRSRST